MGLFSKKPSVADIKEAEDFIAQIKRETDKLVTRYSEESLQSPVEKSLLLMCAYLCSGKISKKAQECIPHAIVNSYTYATISNSIASEAGYISILYGEVSDTFHTALKRGINPVYELYEKFGRGKLLNHRIFKENPFFAIELKRTLNNVIENMYVSSLYEYKFPANELIFPKPKVFINRSKAPQKVLEKSDGTPEYFHLIAELDLNHSTYWVLQSIENDEYVFLKTVHHIGSGNTKIEFIHGNEFNEVQDAFLKVYDMFSSYKCPLY